MEIMSWEEVYDECDERDDLKYFWEKFDLNINYEIEEDRRIN